MMVLVSYQVVTGPAGDPVPARATVSGRGSRPTTSSVVAAPGQYVVRPGDTLADVAVKAGVDTLSLATWNGITNLDVLEVGQQLRLSAPASSGSVSSTTTYQVQPGDSVTGIADTFGISAARLAKVNQLLDSDDIQAGIVLTIPPS